MAPHDAEVAWNEPWMRNFNVKPYSGDLADAVRFSRDFLDYDIMDEADKTYSMRDVLDGTHE